MSMQQAICWMKKIKEYCQCICTSTRKHLPNLTKRTIISQIENLHLCLTFLLQFLPYHWKKLNKYIQQHSCQNSIQNKTKHPTNLLYALINMDSANWELLAIFPLLQFIFFFFFNTKPFQSWWVGIRMKIPRIPNKHHHWESGNCWYNSFGGYQLWGLWLHIWSFNVFYTINTHSKTY